jgi:uncharacterized protein YwqG
MSKDEIFNLIDTSGVKNRDVIKSLLLPSIGLKLNSKHAKIETSKIGGYPSISGENWPSFNKKSLLFLGQISLAQISHMNNILPRKGILCFFLFTDDIGSRYPDKKGEFKIIYKENIHQELSIKSISSIKEYSISFFEYYTFPSYQEYIIKKNKISENDLSYIEEFENEVLSSVDESYDIPHQLLGHPKAIQGTVRFWWAAKYLGFDEKTSFSPEEMRLIKMEEGKFILLLQLNFGDSKIEIDYFGDSVAYFGIHKIDLQNKNFDNALLVMQNT